MAKGKKAAAAASSTSYGKKKVIITTGKKPAKKNEPKIDIKKVEIISKKLTKMNKSFECLIRECKVALTKITEPN